LPSTPTPLPLFLLALLTPTPTPFVASPTPTPASAPGTPAPSAAALNLGGGLTLTVDPAQPLTGRPISFSLQGLPGWARLKVTFLDPASLAVAWTDEHGTFLVAQASQAVKSATLYADGQGRVSWARLNALDPEGLWTVKVLVDDQEFRGTYILTPLQVQTTAVSDLGVSFRRYSGSASELYASGGVPLAVTLELSGMLSPLTDRLKPWLSLTSAQIPNVYVFSNKDLFKTAVTAAGATVTGLEAGVYLPFGQHRGLFVIVDEFNSETTGVLIHEYVHLLVEELAPRASVPAWLNEGLATYLDIHVRADFGASLAAQRERYRRADAARKALATNALLPLSRLVSQRDWNAETDRERASLQYAEAYMAVRYLLERFGNQAAALIIGEMAKGASFEAAFQRVTGVSLSSFEQDWRSWLGQWQDNLREGVRSYVTQVDAIMEEVAKLDSDRGAFIQASGAATFSQRVAAQTQFLERAESLESRALALSPPAPARVFHSDLAAFLLVQKRWLQRELDASRQGSNAIINEANAMIPEVSGRQGRAVDALWGIKYNWQVGAG
ncbi:MAG: hypothetical protein HY535_00340, partial [Chloroflexi bacterium]|nr:hypothetical protein [Chloroflexota bacterium]